MFIISLPKMLLIAWSTLLGADEWIIREEAEAQIKAINNEYDCMDIVKELIKSKDLEVKRRARRIYDDYFPDVKEFPKFQCYCGIHEPMWKEHFQNNFYLNYAYDVENDLPKPKWVTSLTEEEQRSFTGLLIREWIKRGHTLKVIKERLSEMWRNEAEGRFFNTSTQEY